LDHVLTFWHITNNETSSNINKPSRSLEERTGTVVDHRAVAWTANGACGAVEGIIREELGPLNADMGTDRPASYLADAREYSVNTQLNERASRHIEDSFRGVSSTTANLNRILTLRHITNNETTSNVNETTVANHCAIGWTSDRT
jgi:hypothetical protein